MDSNSRLAANAVEEYVLIKSVKKMISCPFSITYLNHINFLSAKQEYAWLKYYVDNSLEPEKSELSSLLYPVFCYLYIILLKKGENEGAAVFFESYSILFSTEKNLAFLTGLRSIDDLENVIAFCNFFKENVKSLSERESIENMVTISGFFNIFERTASENVPTTCLSFTEDENFISKFYELCNKYKSLSIEEDRKVINDFCALWTNRCKSQKCPSSIKSIEDIMAALDFSHFLTHKYIIKISQNVLDDLTSKLESIKSKALVYIMHFYFYFDDRDLEDETCEKSETQEQNSTNQQANSDVEMIEDSKKQVGSDSLKYILLKIPDENKNFNYFPGDINVLKKQLAISIKCDIFVLNNYNSHGKSLPELSTEINLTDDVVHPNKVFGVHSDEILAVKYVSAPQSLDSVFLLTGSIDRTVKILDTEDFKVIDVFTGHKGPVRDIDCSTSLKGYFATASEDCTAALWTLETGSRILKSYIGHVDSVNCVKFHPNALYLATGSSDKSIRFWNLENALCIQCFAGDHIINEIAAISFCCDGNCIASGDECGTIKLWDIRSAVEVHKLPSKGQRAQRISPSFSMEIAMLADNKLLTIYCNQNTNSRFFRCVDIRGSSKDLKLSYEAEIVKEFNLPGTSSVKGCSYFENYFVFYH